MSETIRLTVKHRVLHFPRGGVNYDANPVKFDCPDTPSILIRRYDSGDCDTIAWPMPKRKLPELRKLLARALYDERESNSFFPSDAVIELPDGTVFDFDSILAGA